MKINLLPSLKARIIQAMTFALLLFAMPTALLAAGGPVVDYKDNMPFGECQEISVLNAREGETHTCSKTGGGGSMDGCTYCATETCAEGQPEITVTDGEGMQTSITIGLYPPEDIDDYHKTIAQECTQNYPPYDFCEIVFCCWELVAYSCEGEILPGSPGLYNYCGALGIPEDPDFCEDSCASLSSSLANNYPIISNNECCPNTGPPSGPGPGPPPPDGATPPPPSGPGPGPGPPPPPGGCEEGQCCIQGNVGNPINFLDGSKREKIQDLYFPGSDGGLVLNRHYHSLYGADGNIGHRWNHTYGPVLKTHSYETHDLSIKDVDGRGLYFKQTSSGTYTGLYTETTTVVSDTSGYTWYRRNGSQFRFDSTGRLVAIASVTGNQKTLSYDSLDRLEMVLDVATGRSITFQYDQDDRIYQIIGPVTVAVPDGIWATYQYDAAGNLSDVIYPDGSGFVYQYTDPNYPYHMSEKYDRQGNLLNTWAYDADGRGIYSWSNTGDDFTIVYGEDIEDNKVMVTDADGITKTYTISRFNGIKRIISVENNTGCASGCSNAVGHYSYDADYNVIQNIYANGRVDQYFDFTPNGYPQKEIRAWGTSDEKTIYYTYHPTTNEKTSRIEPSALGPGNKETIWDYDDDGDTTPNESPTGLLHRMIERGYTYDGTGAVVPSEYITSYTYNANGQLETVDGPLPGNQDLVTFTYDPVTGERLTVTRPLVGTTQYFYDAAGNVESVTDVNGVLSSFTYDGRNRQHTVTRDGVTTSRTYTADGKLDTATDPIGRIMDYDYTPEGLLESITDPSGNYMYNIYNDHGQRIEASIYSAAGLQTQYRGYDFGDPATNLDISPGKPWKLIRRNHDDTADLETVYTYDVAGNVQSVTDANQNTTSYLYDLFNRLEQVEQPGYIVTAYDYDAHGNLNQVTDAEGHITTYQYDDMGRLVATVSSDTGTTRYAYGADGTLSAKIQNGKVVSYLYDVLGRLTDILYTDSSQNVTNTYDTGSGDYLVGRLASTTDDSGTTEYSYTAQGRLASQTRAVDGVAYTTGYGYDDAGNLRSMTYPSGLTVSYLPDAVDPALIGSVVLNGSQTLASGISYQPFGPLSDLTFGNGIVLNKGFDKNYQIGTLIAGSVMNRTYTPDGVGNIEQIVDNLDSTRSQVFGYDDLYRLISASGIYGSIDYSYDDVGNRLTRTDSQGTDSYTYLTGTNKLRTVSGPNAKSYSYDPDGNVIAALGGAQPPLADQAEYEYGNNGQRGKKTADAQGVVFHYDLSGQLIAETDAVGNLIKAYVWLHGQPLAMIDGGGAVYYFHCDHLGTPQRVTNGSGGVVWSGDYLPFGGVDVTVEGVVNNLRFAGQYFDQETGLHYNYHRYYDPGLGRYLRADPKGLEGDINLYAYVENNPIDKIDPFGMDSIGYKRCYDQLQKRIRCEKAAYRAFRKCTGNLLLQNAACFVACAKVCIFAGPAYGACMFACNAGCSAALTPGRLKCVWKLMRDLKKCEDNYPTDDCNCRI